MKKQAVFFDRDGTLMEEVHYCNDPAKVVAAPDAAASLGRLHAAGWLNIIITNQSGLAYGKILPSQYEAVEAELGRQLGGHVDATYFCPDPSHSPTHRRKPGIGMIEEAARDHGIDLPQSWMVGDKGIDIACGRAAGCRTILVLTGYGEKFRDCGADFVVRDAAEAAGLILAGAAPCNRPGPAGKPREQR